MLENRWDGLCRKVLMIDVKNDELLGEYIIIKKGTEQARDSIMIKVVGDHMYTLGELVITDKMKVFYNHKKREMNENIF